MRPAGKHRVFRTQSPSVTAIPRGGAFSRPAQGAGRRPARAHFIHEGAEQGGTWDRNASTHSPTGMPGSIFDRRTETRVSTHTDAQSKNTRSPRRRRTARPRSGERSVAERVCREDCRHTAARGTEQPAALCGSGRQDHRARCPQHGAGSDETVGPRDAQGSGARPQDEHRARSAGGHQHHGGQPPSRPTGGQTLKGTKLPEQARRDCTVSASPQRSQKGSHWLTHQGPGSDTRVEETSPQENEKVRDD